MTIILLALIDDRSYYLDMSRVKRTGNTRSALLSEGFKCLSKQGYNGTGLKQILDRVKVPKGSFYHYFESKEHFVAEVLEYYVNHLLNLFDEHLVKSDGDPIQSIKALYQIMINEFERSGCTYGCLLGSLAAELGNQSALLQRTMQSAYSRWADRFLSLVLQAQQHNLMRTDIPPEEITEMFWCAWEGAILRMNITGKSDVLTRVLSMTLDALLTPDAAIAT